MQLPQLTGKEICPPAFRCATHNRFPKAETLPQTLDRPFLRLSFHCLNTSTQSFPVKNHKHHGQGPILIQIHPWLRPQPDFWSCHFASLPNSNNLSILHSYQSNKGSQESFVCIRFLPQPTGYMSLEVLPPSIIIIFPHILYTPHSAEQPHPDVLWSHIRKQLKWGMKLQGGSENKHKTGSNFPSDTRE